MRKVISVVVITILLFSFSLPVYADEGTNGPIKKLGRGTANVITAVCEIPKGINDANQESGMFAAFTWGIFQGIMKTVVRMTVGVYEIITFPIPLPADYKPILTDPEFFMDSDTMI